MVQTTVQVLEVVGLIIIDVIILLLTLLEILLLWLYGWLRERNSGAANSGDNTYGIFVGGTGSGTNAYSSSMQKITIATTGTASSGFGTFSTSQKAYAAGCASSSHSYFAGALYPNTDIIDKHSIASGGSATNIGTLSAPIFSCRYAGRRNYGFYSGGYGSTYYSNIEQLNFSSDAVAANFGSGLTDID